MVQLQANLPEFERQRLDRIAHNKRKMEELGMLRQRTIMESFRAAKCQLAKASRPLKRKIASSVTAPPRRSKRLLGGPMECAELSDDERPLYEDELIDLMERRCKRQQTMVPEQPSQEQLEAIQQKRCNSQGRGSVYDSAVGITCHFCRQKKLCGEPDCQRCQTRNVSLECIGKTECSRCHSAYGKFCRACLLIRYGQELEEAQQQMADGTWLCPHCYEEEHPEEGWICNSSICMKRRGLKPTGIAIFEAQERGFASVAQLLQAQLKALGGVQNVQNATAATTTAAAATTTATAGTTKGTQQQPTTGTGPSTSPAAHAGPQPAATCNHQSAPPPAGTAPGQPESTTHRAPAVPTTAAMAPSSDSPSAVATSPVPAAAAQQPRRSARHRR